MKILLLFDVDGTICRSGQVVDDEWIDVFNKLNNFCTIGILGGGEYDCIVSQLHKINHNIEYVISDNGMMLNNISNNDNCNMIHNDKYIIDKIKNFNNQLKKYNKSIVDDCVKIRKYCIYYVPYGINSDTDKRNKFIEKDEKTNMRINIINHFNTDNKIRDKYDIFIGGEMGISFSYKNCNKSNVENLIDLSEYDNIYFFGDKLLPYGNDEPVKSISKITCIQVKNPDETLFHCKKLLQTIV